MIEPLVDAEDVETFPLRFRYAFVAVALEVVRIPHILVIALCAPAGAVVGIASGPAIRWHWGAAAGAGLVTGGYVALSICTALYSHIRDRAWEVRCRCYLQGGRFVIETQEHCTIISALTVWSVRRCCGIVVVFHFRREVLHPVAVPACKAAARPGRRWAGGVGSRVTGAKAPTSAASSLPPA